MNPQDPAFAHVYYSAETSRPSYTEPGLTKRELFAAMAMQGLLSNAHISERFGTKDEDIATESVIFADALIAELSK